jgi:hypothetical protein
MTQIELNIELLRNIKDPNLINVKNLISQGANINFSFGDCPMVTYAIFYSNAIAKYLIENGVDLIYKSRSKDFNTPFHYLYISLNMTISSKIVEKNRDDMREWLGKYDIQKMIIERDVRVLYEFVKYKVIHPQIKIDYQHLLTANELNLL